MLAQKVRKMLSITRVRKGQADEQDLSEVVKDTAVLLKENYKNEQVRKMFTCYQNLWMTFVAAHTSKYNPKKSNTFGHEEMHQLLKILQEKPTSKGNLHGVAISLLWFGLLHTSEIKEIQVRDVIVKDGSILATFNHNPK